LLTTVHTEKAVNNYTLITQGKKLSAITFIGSGSKGNAALLELGNKYYLLDAGFSCKKIAEFLASRQLDFSDLSGIFVTHEHEDHSKGLRVILNKNPELPIFCTKGTSCAIQKKGVAVKNSIDLKFGSEIELNGVRCFPFKVPHDATEPTGLRFEHGGKVMAIATDLGHITPEVRNHMLDAHLLCIESNYDEDMLRSSIYPAWLKKRIRSPFGHLPNQGFRGILSRMKQAPEILVLMHVSQESNTHSLVEETVSSFVQLNRKRFAGTRISVAKQNLPGERLALKPVLSARIKEKILTQNTFENLWPANKFGTNE
jgi:phosphoribosyl 1,2-cyclic phosphodiesterase